MLGESQNRMHPQIEEESISATLATVAGAASNVSLSQFI